MAQPEPAGRKIKRTREDRNRKGRRLGGSNIVPDQLLSRIQKELKVNLSKAMGIGHGDIDLHAEMSDFGLDSITITTLVDQYNLQYGLDLTPAIFFEHTTLASFTGHLRETYVEHFQVYYRELSAGNQAESQQETSDEVLQETTDGDFSQDQQETWHGPTENEDGGGPTEDEEWEDEPIAIVGMAGIFPQSEDLDAFWDHLIQGHNLITEIPADRWDWRSVYGDPAEPGNRTNVKWGGFMPDVDKFDSLFFNISPHEAKYMDPQQRIFLETVWKTIEDAGYHTGALAGTRTGLFVGVGSTDYGDLLKLNGAELDAYAATGLSHAILPNRISYLLDIYGPSEPVNTACASSLVAIHRAVESIRQGECDMAIAGGINTLLSPAPFIMLSKGEMLSADGVPRPFDKKANGYVRGEGSGAIFLKPLGQAERDGDHIYAVIKGCAVNHGGRSNGLTAPNTLAQAEVLIDAYQDGDVDPATVSYIETAANGSELGDPIEVNGIKKAFEFLYKEWDRPQPVQPHCGIGTVKANIGHLETASGITGVIKVLLAMKKRRLPGLINLTERNPYVQTEGTPLFIVEEARSWEPVNGPDGRPMPRRAGVSSFGFGGVNAHLVLEAHEDTLPPRARSPFAGRPQVLPLSARNSERLHALAKRLSAFLRREENQSLDFVDLAYTLQVGRDQMNQRLAIVVSDTSQLIERLDAFCRSEESVEDLYLGNIKKSRFTTDFLNDGREGQEFLRIIFQDGKMEKMARLWIAGVNVDWENLYQHDSHAAWSPRRLSLPTYPFVRKRHWFEAGEQTLQLGSPCGGQTEAPHSPDTDSALPNPSAEIESISHRLSLMVAEFLGIDPAEIKPDEDLSQYGFDSFSGMKLIRRIQEFYGVKIPNKFFFEYPTIRDTASYILDALGGGRHLYDDGDTSGPDGEIAPPVDLLPDRSQQQVADFDPSLPIVAHLREMVAASLGLDRTEVDPENDLSEYGFDSFSGMKLIRKIHEHYGTKIPNKFFFEYPTILETADFILSAQAASGGEAEPPASVEPEPERKLVTDLPLTRGQQGLWFIDWMEPGHLASHILSAFMINAELKATLLRETFEMIIDRHPTLRSSIVGEKGKPSRTIHPRRDLFFEHEDFSALSWEQCQAKIKQVARLPFDLVDGPLLRIHVFTRSPNQHILLVAVHHIVADGTSFAVLLNEINQIYTGLLDGKRPRLAPLEAEYNDFVLWQENMLASQEGAAHLAYWREKLTGELPHLELPLDFARPAVPTYTGAVYGVTLEGDLLPRLKAMARKERVSLFILLLAAYKLLLYRYTNQSDLLVGSATGGRPESRFDQLIGYFVNMVVLRDRVSGSESFLDFMAQVKTTVLDGLDHCDYPFSMLVDDLGANKEKSRTPLFQVDFLLQNWVQVMDEGVLSFGKPKSLHPRRLNLERMDFIHEIGGFDLTLEIFDVGEGSKAYFQYNPDLFKEETIVRMAAQFKLLLGALLEDPHGPMGRLPMLPPQERTRLLTDLSGPAADYDLERGVHQLVEAQVARTGDATAVVLVDVVRETCRSLSYDGFNQLANGQARRLLERGVGPGDLIGICLERSPETMVAVLAVLKTGAAYVPLDPAYPKKRLAQMLTDAAPSLIIVSERTREALPPTEADLVLMDGEPGEIEDLPVDNLDRAPAPEGLVYVTFTSGSTSRPKGVMVRHRALTNAYRAWHESYGLGPAVRSHLQMASFSFDVFAGDFVRALCSGGELVICQRDRLLDPARLYRLMLCQAVDCAEFVPAVLRVLIDHIRDLGEDLSFMKLLIAGSDSWSVQEYRTFRLLCGPHTRFINSYGVTEATIDTTYYESGLADLDIHDLVAEWPVPIGIPFGNMKVYLLDGYGGPVPTGVHGELYIGGEGLARGYWNRAELTAEQFVPDPFADRAGSRLYRSGDKARFLDGGVIQFLGRLDFQVKIRGLRIELGEIETVLKEHHSLSAAVVQIKSDDRSGGKHLVAYVAGREDGEVHIGELQEALRARLPEYMVPSAFVILATMPLMPNGKIDRKALPDPDWHLSELARDFLPPRTSTEELLAGIWRGVLQTERIGVDDNFFELGGHSLIATQVTSRIREVFNREISLRDFFQGPTIAALAKRIDISESGRDRYPIPPLKAVDRGGELPLSFAQHRLWFIDQLEPGNVAYNIPSATEFRGAFQLKAFEWCVDEIVRRHESLRTHFADSGGEPRQIIHEHGAVPLKVLDLSAFTDADNRLIQTMATGDARLAFDLSSGPLFRMTLLRMNQRRHVLLLNMHHTISDGWSMGVFVEELIRLYDAFSKGQVHSSAELALSELLPPLPFQYADFAAWQQQWLQGELLQDHLAYWRDQLAGAPPVLELPGDRPRPKLLGFEGANLPVYIDPGVTAAMNRFCLEQGVTLYMGLLAAFKLLLSRYSGQKDISVGTVFANRNQGELEHIIGCFVNTLVMRTDLSGVRSFRELAGKVRHMTLDAYAHQDMPFEKLVEALQPERSLSHTPLFQVLFLLHNAPMPNIEMAGLTINRLHLERGVAQFDLGLQLMEANREVAETAGGERGLKGFIEYNTDLFDRETIERLVRHFQNLLAAVTADADADMARMAFLNEDERRHLLEELSGGRSRFPAETCLHQTVSSWARRRPDAVALAVEDEGQGGCRLEGRLTYAELDHRSQQLAGLLRSRGVGPESRVGLYIQPSFDTLIAVLAVLKAGGAYVPLNPADPAERLAFILEDAGLALLLVAHERAADLPDHSVPVVHPEAAKTLDEAQWSETNTPVNLAYIIYTSGSTGKPKGSLVTHENVTRLFAATAEWFGFDENDVWALFHSYAFDVSVWEIWGALLHGGSLVVVPYFTVRSPGHFRRMLSRQRVTVLNQTPSAFNQLAQADADLIGPRGADAPSSLALRRIVFAGEALNLQSLQPWWERHGDSKPRLINMYGITETTVHVTYRSLGMSDLSCPGSLIGGPMLDLELYVLDRYMQLQPLGVHGELFVGGAGLSRGYRHRADLTAARFVPHPFSRNPGERLYKSGDLARRLTDGDVEYLGRADFQVKIRGFRMELGEIEALIAQIPGVAENAVLARDDMGEGKTLVAYVVGGGDLSPAALREFLIAKLPEYMVPSAFVILQRLPVTANGKLDRRALPLPERSREDLETAYVAPRNGVEERLVGILARILKLEQVGIRDDFFELGGHSLLATQYITQVNDAFQIALPLRAVFQNPSAADLGQNILAEQENPTSDQQANPLHRAGITIQRTSRDKRLPLSAAQMRLWMIDQLLVDRQESLNSGGGLNLHGQLEPLVLQRVLAELMRRHEIWRTEFAEKDGNPYQVIHAQLNMPFECLDLSAMAPKERRAEANRILLKEDHRYVDLSRAPLVKTLLVRLAPSEHILYINMHHIVSDGWSVGVMRRELVALYQAFLTDQPSPLADPTIQYADFAAWQQERMTPEVVEEYLTYWRQCLGDLPPELELPGDSRKPFQVDTPHQTEPLLLDSRLTRALKDLARMEQASLFMVLLSGYYVLLNRYSGQADLSVGTLIANRNHPQTQELLGFFLNTLVFRTSISAELGFRELIGRVREVTLGAYAYQDIPFEALLDDMLPQRQATGQTMFQTMFVLQNFPISEIDLPGMKVATYELEGLGSHAPTHTALVLEETSEGLEGGLEYHPDIFSPETIVRMAGHFIGLLSQMVAQPDLPLSQLSLLSTKERGFLLGTLNQTEAEYPGERAMADLIEDRAAQTPDAPAVAMDGKVWPYAELNARANRFAHLLIAEGIGADDFVGLVLKRSFDMIAALLGVLKAGAAYLPLDPEYPPDRLAYMMADAGVKLLLTQEAVSGKIPDSRSLVIDGQARELLAGASSDNPALVTSPDHLAYAIYTSGSTGQPKGVAIRGRSLVQYSWAAIKLFDLTAEDCVLQFASVNFDTAGEEIYPCLCAGAELVLRPENMLDSVATFLETCSVERISVLDLPTAYWHTIVAELETHAAKLGDALRLIIIGGEKAAPEQLRTWREYAPARVRILNTYGPTEATIVATSCCLTEEGFAFAELAPIGKPVENTRVYVLDALGQPLPVGLPGELHIGGHGLARAYLNRPAQTAEKFIPDGFGGEAGERLYRSGDLVRFLEDGNLDFVGRIDHQVKIRGFRVELGEIETALLQQPSIRQAVVLALSSGGGAEKRLVGYLVPVEGEKPALPDLKETLGRLLPDYMVPGTFVFQQELPLTTTGKVNRKLLAQSDPSLHERETEYVEAENPIEETVIEIWQEVLGTERIGIYDNFFDLGGQSLLATQVIYRINNFFEVSLTIRDLFEEPTVSNISLKVGEILFDELDDEDDEEDGDDGE